MKFIRPESTELFSPEHENIEKFAMEKAHFFRIVDPPETPLLQPPEILSAHLVELSKAHRLVYKRASRTTTNTPINSLY